MTIEECAREIADLTAKLEKRDKSLEWHQDQMALAQCAQFDAEEKLEKAEAMLQRWVDSDCAKASGLPLADETTDLLRVRNEQRM
jgi:hypothetical protein